MPPVGDGLVGRGAAREQDPVVGDPELRTGGEGGRGMRRQDECEEGHDEDAKHAGDEQTVALRSERPHVLVAL